jgi:hypothetical protein
VRETKVEGALTYGVELRGGKCLKWTSPGRKGAPDRIVLMPGAHMVFVETKAPGGKLEPWQRRFHTMLWWLGFRVEVLWNLEQVADFLETI